jgi:hypothetical protein
LRVGIFTEIGARVGVGPVGIFEAAMISPGWMGRGVETAPLTGAKGSYVGKAVAEAGVQEETEKVIIKQYALRRSTLHDGLRNMPEIVPKGVRKKNRVMTLSLLVLMTIY